LRKLLKPPQNLFSTSRPGRLSRLTSLPFSPFYFDVPPGTPA
jgi:hypothetical protein